MIQTPKMWEINQRIQSLTQWVKADPGDYMLQFELDELKAKYANLNRIEKLGLRLIPGGKTSSNLAYRLNKHLVLIQNSDPKAS